MRLLLSSLLLLLLTGNSLPAQPLIDKGIFIPLEIQEAYEEGTRLPNGMPGPNYWQNFARYDIDVRIDPEEQMLYGKETVLYQNHSPDVLNQLVFQLLYDIYREGNPRDNRLPPEDITQGVQLDYILINGDTIEMTNQQQTRRGGTNLSVRLPQPLQPEEEVTVDVKWSEPIPPSGIRVGAYDSTSYFIGYWYPKIAVYDDIDGWDTRSYTGQEEFYSNLASYDVRITVPDSFLVLGTGKLQNAENLLLPGAYEKYQRAQESDSTITIISEAEADEGIVMRAGTWHYRADSVPDFAFFTSDHFIWEGASQKVEPERRVFISTLYPPENAEPYQGVTQIQRAAMDFFSDEISGIPYPYPAYTSINAAFGGGMEFPMLANNGAPPNRSSMANLTAHEMHHMYLPFYVRINEKKYGWMDEGWADYITSLALERQLIGEAYREQVLDNLKFVTESAFGRMANVPLITLSAYTDSDNYGFTTYSYAHLTYRLLHDILGEETFVKCFREYIRRWAYKSPTPYDFFFTFEDLSGQDLSWFWKPWYFEYGHANLSVAMVKKNQVKVSREGKRPLPVDLRITYADGTTETMRRSPAIWKDGNRSFVHKLPRKKTVEKIILNADWPDANDLNNVHFSEERLAAIGELGPYGGSYAINPLVQIDIEAQSYYLKLELPAANLKKTLFPDGENRFTSLGEDMVITFNTNEAGEITGMFAEIFGNRIPARKMD